MPHKSQTTLCQSDEDASSSVEQLNKGRVANPTSGNPTIKTAYIETPKQLSELGKLVLKNCTNAYVNELGQVIDPCHVYWSEQNDPTKW